MASESVMNNEGGVKISMYAPSSPKTTSATRPFATVIPLRVFKKRSSNENKSKKMPKEVKLCFCKRSSSGRLVTVKLDKNLKQYIEQNFQRAWSMKITELEQNDDLLRSSSELLKDNIKDMYDMHFINKNLKCFKF